MPEPASPQRTESTQIPLTPSRTISFIGGESLVIVGMPKATASYSGRPRPSQRDGERQTWQVANWRRCSSVGRSSSSITTRSSPPAACSSLPALRSTWPRMSSLRWSPPGARERLDDLGEGLALAHEAARDVEPGLVGGALDPLGDRQELGMAAPGEQGAVDPERRVAVLLGLGERVDRVVGLLRGLGVLGGEALPDEAADRPHAVAAQAGDLLELVVLVGEHDIERVRRHPGLVLGRRDVGLAALGHPRLVPDRVGDPLLLSARALALLGEHEGLVPELVERRTDLPGDHGLAARKPLAD